MNPTTISEPEIRDVVGMLHEKASWITEDRFLLLSLSGSRAYGINFPHSDWDFISVVVPPEEGILGLTHWESERAMNDQMDIRAYSPRKFFQMLLQGSVNNLEILYLPTMWRSPLLDPLWDQRYEFITPSTLNSIEGYTHSTLGRFTDPARAEHGSKRRTYIETYGYDVSAAAHCFRWLWMGLDLVEDSRNLTIQMHKARKLFLWTVKDGKIPVDMVTKEIHRNLDKFLEIKEDLYELLSHRKGHGNGYAVANETLITLHRQVLNLETA